MEVEGRASAGTGESAPLPMLAGARMQLREAEGTGSSSGTSSGVVRFADSSAGAASSRRPVLARVEVGKGVARGTASLALREVDGPGRWTTAVAHRSITGCEAIIHKLADGLLVTTTNRA